MADSKVPAGALRVEIDDPSNRRLTTPVGLIRGWFAALDVELPEQFRLRVGGVNLPYDVVKREDVESAMPSHSVSGFVIRYDLVNYLPHIENGRLVISLALPGYDPYRLRFQVEDGALAACLESAGM